MRAKGRQKEKMLDCLLSLLRNMLQMNLYMLLDMIRFGEACELISAVLALDDDGENTTYLIIFFYYILNQEDQNKLIKWTLSIFHNCAGTDDNIPILRDIEVIQVVLCFCHHWHHHHYQYYYHHHHFQNHYHHHHHGSLLP